LLELPELPDDVDPSVDVQAVTDSDDSASATNTKTAESILCNFISNSLSTDRHDSHVPVPGEPEFQGLKATWSLSPVVLTLLLRHLFHRINIFLAQGLRAASACGASCNLV
jgi:hypothetical protein